MMIPPSTRGVGHVGQPPACPVSVSFTLETDGRLPAGKVWRRRSRPWTGRRQAPRPTTGSTARTRRISQRRSTTRPPGASGLEACAPMPRGAAMPSSTSRPTSMPVILPNARPNTAFCSPGIRRSACSGDVATPDHRHLEAICGACIGATPRQRGGQGGAWVPLPPHPRAAGGRQALLARLRRPRSLCDANGGAGSAAGVAPGAWPKTQRAAHTRAITPSPRGRPRHSRASGKKGWH